MKTIDRDVAAALMNFAPTQQAEGSAFARAQLDGAVAAYNMLARNSIAYIADEVGMGKTYVALGVMGLLRHFNPAARVVVLAPRENLQHKWIKELGNFTRHHWQVEDNRVRGLQAEPVHPPVACNGIQELARAIRSSDHSDLFLRYGSFSVSVKDGEARKRCRDRLKPYLPWLPADLLDARRSDHEFRDMYGRALNALLPPIDLLVVDEAHNFKHGFGPRVSNRNRLLGMALGHASGEHPDCDWYGPRVRNLLMLSATPFEHGYGDVYRQLDVLTKGDLRITDADGADPQPVRTLNQPDADEEYKSALLNRFLLRRIFHLNIAGDHYSKNMYRREWRRGGYQEHDEPMTLDEPKQRLMVGLMQKKVSELLGDRRFNNSFQIGMLSSFESFLESMARDRKIASAANDGSNGDGHSENEEDDESGPPVFDGQQTEDRMEREGVDSQSLQKVVQSYHRRFGQSPPHPKLDATADQLATSFQSAQKSLVFVRRIATTAELKSKLDRLYDQWMMRRLRNELPQPMQPRLEAIFEDYESQRPRDPHEAVSAENSAGRDESDDAGGNDTFFAWFFRGAGPAGVLSGASLQRNRLGSPNSNLSTLFEDDHVSWLLGYPDQPLSTLADHLSLPLDELRPELRRRAWGHYTRRTGQRQRFPPLYVLEAFQIAGLRMLTEHSTALSEQAARVLADVYEDTGCSVIEPPTHFPQPDQHIGVRTFVTELVQRPALRQQLWPDESSDDFARDLRRRELRRALLSAQARLGAAYIDLYIAAMHVIGSFETGRDRDLDQPVPKVATAFLDRLELQAEQAGMHAFHELATSADTFDTLLAVNFPEVQTARLVEMRVLFARALQRQVPIGRMHGGVNRRLVRQFRMPGYPLVLITTDVLQEGEDLHPFCKHVVHYGLTWTPSAMEQRTGRVDRIGSLIQRQLDGRATPPEPNELLQVYYPHLEDTVERLQVRRVMERLNRFIEMIHRSVSQKQKNESRVDVNREVLRGVEPPPAPKTRLESAYPVTDDWLHGELRPTDIEKPNLEKLDARFEELWQHLLQQLDARVAGPGSDRRHIGKLAIQAGQVTAWTTDTSDVRYQRFDLQMHSQVAGDATLLRCISPIGHVNLNDRDLLDTFYEWQRSLDTARLCAKPVGRGRWSMTVELDRLFRLETTQPAEVVEMVTTATTQADQIEQAVFGEDQAVTAETGGDGDEAKDG